MLISLQHAAGAAGVQKLESNYYSAYQKLVRQDKSALDVNADSILAILNNLMIQDRASARTQLTCKCNLQILLWNCRLAYSNYNSIKTSFIAGNNNG